MKKTFLLFVFLCLFVFATRAQTLYAIVAANTDEQQIGRSCERDMVHFTATLNTIANAIGLQPKLITISRTKFLFDNVKSEIDAFRCTDKDIVVFYYSGHGENKQQSDFPSLLFNDANYELETLHNQLKQKGARLVITIGDCCNILNTMSVQNKGFRVVPVHKDSLANYRNLFLSPKGDVIISASSKWQFAYSNSEIGGYFTHEFLISLTSAINYSTSLSWNMLLDDTKNRLKKYTFAEGEQVPYYKVNVTQTDAPNPTPAITYAEINKYFADLMNDKNDQKTIREQYQKYFDKNARVDIFADTLLTDMMTIENFLDRIMLHCKKINTINLIENLSKFNTNGKKYNQITVQELWLKTKD